MPNVEPDAWSQDGVLAPSTMSEAVAVYVTTAPAGPVASTVMSLGSDSTGAVVSTTVTPNAAADELPCASEAEQCTVVEPNPKVEPLVGEQLTGTVPSTASDALGANATGAPAGPVAS